MSISELNTEQWTQIIISFFIVVGVILLGRWVVHFIYRRILKRVISRTKTTFDDMIAKSTEGPIYWLVVFLSVEFALQRLDFLSSELVRSVEVIFFVGYLMLAFIFGWRFLVNFFVWYGREMALRTETKLDEQLMPFFSRVALIVLSTVCLIILLGHFEVDVSGLITTLGVGSLAIALAAQAALSDTISGFVIMIDRPFRIGDRIEIQDLGTWGDVVDIGLRSSQIRTRDNRMVIVPNSVISKSLVVNYTYPSTEYRIQIHIGVAYGTDLEHARKTIVDAVKGVDGVLADRPVEALFLEFGESALMFRVRWWLDSYEDTRRMFDRVNTAIYNALQSEGIEIPVPQREILHKFTGNGKQFLADSILPD